MQTHVWVLWQRQIYNSGEGGEEEENILSKIKLHTIFTDFKVTEFVGFKYHKKWYDVHEFLTGPCGTATTSSAWLT
jgi:hypothetical protein